LVFNKDVKNYQIVAQNKNTLNVLLFSEIIKTS